MESEKTSSFPWLNTLLSYFQNLKQIDDEIELIRVSLCEKSLFSPLSLFDYLDIDSKSFLTLNDFISFLRSQNSTYDERKLRKMIHNFDKDNDFSINLNEFLGLILPRKNSVLKKNILSLSYSYANNNNKNVSQEIISTLNDLILREMKLIEELDEISRKIKNSKIFSTYEAFTAIVGDDKYMTRLNLNNFLKDNGVHMNNEEVAQLMFRLDADNDDKISYEEFKEMFYPLKEDFVYIPKDVSNSKDKINYNNNYNYEKSNKYSYISNNNNYNYINDEKDYDYNSNDYNDINNSDDNDNNYNNDYNNNIDDKDNNNYNSNEYNDNNKENESNINTDKGPGKKGKKTKKVILKKPGVRGNNNESGSNLLHSQGQKNNYLKNYQQESHSKFPNINNNNSTDNYTLNRTSKTNNIISLSKKYKNKEPSLNEDNNNNNNEYSYNSKITQKSLIINQSNNTNNLLNKYKYIDNNNEIEDNQIPDNDNDNNNITNNYNNYESKSTYRTKNKKFYSISNNYNNDNDDDNGNHEYKTGKCKGCQYTAKNIYNNYRTINSKSSPLKHKEEYNFESQIKSSSNKVLRNKNNNSNINNQINDIYKRKEELLNKYGYFNNNDDDMDRDRDNFIFNSEEKISTSINRHYSSSPNKAINDNNINNDINDIDNENNDYNDDNDNANNNNEIEENNTLGMHIKREKSQNRYIPNNINNNKTSSSHLLRDNNNNANKNNFSDRFKKVKENKEFKLSTQNQQFKKNNIKENNIYEKRNLLFKLLQDFIEQENKLEEIKESLADCQDASLTKIFEVFNQNKKNLIFSSDLYEILNTFSPESNFTPNDIKYILKKYNKSIESGFNYDEFCNIISPRKISSKLILENRNKSSLNNDFEEETKNKIVELFGQLIEGEKSSEEIRTMISMAADNIFYDLFGGIKKENKPGIQRDDIDKFMRENGYNIKDNEIEIIMEKMDKNKDNIIDYEEFISEIQPKIA